MAVELPRRPLRHGTIATLPASSADEAQTKRKGEVAPSTKGFKGLPVELWTNTSKAPTNQLIKYLKENTMRVPETQEEIAKWRTQLQNNPFEMSMLTDERHQ